MTARRPIVDWQPPRTLRVRLARFLSSLITRTARTRTGA
jgi:hypothetical protein